MDIKKERLDILITELGLSASREKARSQIMAGIVFVDGIKIDKPGTKVSTAAKIDIKGDAVPYVSRGGLKLEKALKHFNIDLSNSIAMDIGASTGGFTDCMLKNGAAKVYAIDVGYGQLAWSLRTDHRVVCMERTNIRYVTRETVSDFPDFASIDVSFISLTKVLPVVIDLLSESGRLICLIKPQFEAGKEKVGKKGVVRDINIHIEVIEKITMFCINNLKLNVLGLTFSPIKGPEGNIEFLIYLSKNHMEKSIEDVSDAIHAAAEQANSSL